MADVVEHILVPAASGDLLTLDEAKLLTAVSSNDSSQDDLLTLLISTVSAQIANLCNPTRNPSASGLGKVTVDETWRELETSCEGTRIYLMHWPVAAADVTLVTDNGSVIDSTGWELEEGTGKLTNYSGWSTPVVVSYTGGYDLPDEAPLALKQAAGLLLREAKRQIIYSNIEGIRMLSHKHSRVQFMDPTKLLTAGLQGGGGAKGSSAMIAAQALIQPYVRYWV